MVRMTLNEGKLEANPVACPSPLMTRARSTACRAWREPVAPGDHRPDAEAVGTLWHENHEPWLVRGGRTLAIRHQPAPSPGRAGPCGGPARDRPGPGYRWACDSREVGPEEADERHVQPSEVTIVAAAVPAIGPIQVQRHAGSPSGHDREDRARGVRTTHPARRSGRDRAPPGTRSHPSGEIPPSGFAAPWPSGRWPIMSRFR